MNSYDLKQFIEELLIPDLQKMVDHELHYYAFSIICQAIEVLGGVYDQEDIDEYGASKTRFDNAIDKLFSDKRYREKKHLFYTYLRGPLIHQLRPGEGIYLASVKKDKIKPENHLNRHDESGCIILVIEVFFSNFIGAFNKFKTELNQKKDLDKSKVERPFIYVSNISPPHPTNWWDKETKSVLTVTPSITGRAY
ncbi:MAG: hypothetical protein ABIP97_13350 [Chthoniobacterales bacterium]